MPTILTFSVKGLRGTPSLLRVWQKHVTAGEIQLPNLPHGAVIAKSIDQPLIAPADIPQDTLTYGGHHFKLYTEARNWFQAAQFCRNLGGHLATIHSRGENDVLVKMLDGNRVAWLGASDESTEGKWKWNDGEPVSFNDWLPGEPSNTTHREQGLAFGNQNNLQTIGWNDTNLRNALPFICEWDQ
jgi:hypothetical protein